MSLESLKKQMNSVRPRVLDRYGYYSMHKKDVSFSKVIPANLRMYYQSILGWHSKSVDAVADRLGFKKFKNDTMQINEILKLNNPDILFDDAMLSSLIGSVSFIYGRKDEDGNIKLQVIQGYDATGKIDPTTNLLTEAYMVLARDEFNQPLRELYFTPYNIEEYYNGDLYQSYEVPFKYAPLIPIIHRPDSDRPFGRSRITRSGIYWQNLASSTLERAEITSEFYSFPQKYIIGLDPDAEGFETWKATISAMLQISGEDGGNSNDIKIGQFQTSSMTPHIEMLRMCASGFAGDSGLTLDDLGFPSDNPSSVDAIKASHENLRLSCRKAQRCFSSGFRNMAYMIACLKDEIDYNRDVFMEFEPEWSLLFEPDASTFGAVGDAIQKIKLADETIDTKVLIKEFTGIGVDE